MFESAHCCIDIVRCTCCSNSWYSLFTRWVGKKITEIQQQKNMFLFSLKIIIITWKCSGMIMCIGVFPAFFPPFFRKNKKQQLFFPFSHKIPCIVVGCSNTRSCPANLNSVRFLLAYISFWPNRSCMQNT